MTNYRVFVKYSNLVSSEEFQATEVVSGRVNLNKVVAAAVKHITDNPGISVTFKVMVTRQEPK